MRILLLTDNHAPTGGAEKYFFALKEKLKLQADLTIFSLGFGQCASNGTDYSVLPATRSKWSKLFWQIFRHRRTYQQLRQHIQQFQPDVIHLHNIKQHSAAIFTAVTGYPVVQTIHDYSIVCPAALNLHQNLQACKTGFKRSCFWEHQLKFNRLIYLGLVFSFIVMRKRLRKTIDHFIPVSPLLADYMRAQALQPVTYIPPFKPEIINSANIAPQHGHFLYAGHLGAHKGTQLLIAEFAIACTDNPHLHLTIAGSGVNEKELHELAAQHRVTHQITFAGWLDNLDLLYQSHFAVIAPSIVMEAFGLIITEAMSHQRPVIGSNRGSIPWLIDDQQTGLIFDPATPGDLAAKMLQLAADPALAQRLGKNGYKKMQQFIDNDTALQQIISLYKTTAANKKGARAPFSPASIQL
jgi:glycosyltransferase involved in cell wall biosynthesis